MITIKENQFFTSIVEFEVGQEQQKAFIDSIAAVVELYLKQYRGFVSASFHASDDGRRVINYVQWLSEEDCIASGRTSDTKKASAAILELVKRYGAKQLQGKSGFFRVARVIENTEKTKRVLVLGQLPEVLQSVTEPLSKLGFAVQGSTDWQHASEKLDAKEFELIAFGSSLIGAISERLRLEFAKQNPSVRFVDVFGPIAVKQIISALEDEQLDYITNFHVAEEGQDLLIQAKILKPCMVRIEVYRIPDAPAPKIELIFQSVATRGSFQQLIDASFRKYGLEIVMTVNENKFYMHRIQEV